MMKRGFFLFLILASLVWFFTGSSKPVSAQDSSPTPTPTITSTPADQYSLTLDDGSELVIERHISFGEIAVVVAIGILLVFIVLAILTREVREWIR